MDMRYLARCLAAGRILLGSAALIAPGTLAATWVGSAGRQRAVSVLCRAFGARDLALGLGTLEALGSDPRGKDASAWVRLGALCDGLDTVATLVVFGSLPKRRRFFVLAVAAGATAVGWLAARDDD